MVRDAEGAELTAVVDPSPEDSFFVGEGLRLPSGNHRATLDEAPEKTECDCVLV